MAALVSLDYIHLLALLSYLPMCQAWACRQCHQFFRVVFEHLRDLHNTTGCHWLDILMTAWTMLRREVIETKFVEQLHAWAKVSVIYEPRDLGDVEFLPMLGLNAKMILVDPDRKYLTQKPRLKAMSRRADLSSELALAFMILGLRVTHFVCPDNVQGSICAFVESLHSVMSCEACYYKRKMESYGFEGDDSFSRGRAARAIEIENYHIRISIAGKEGDIGLALRASYKDEVTKVTCGCKLPEQIDWFVVFEYNEDDPITPDPQLLARLSHLLFGCIAARAVVLHVLWRLLCAPTVAWPYSAESRHDNYDELSGPPSFLGNVQIGPRIRVDKVQHDNGDDFFDCTWPFHLAGTKDKPAVQGSMPWDGYQCSKLAATDRNCCADDFHYIPTYLRFRRVFEVMVESLEATSSSELDNFGLLGRLSFGLAGHSLNDEHTVLVEAEVRNSGNTSSADRRRDVNTPEHEQHHPVEAQSSTWKITARELACRLHAVRSAKKSLHGGFFRCNGSTNSGFYIDLVDSKDMFSGLE